MKILKKYIDSFGENLSKYTHESDEHALFEPVNYILQLGGKRLRPAICMMSCDLFGGEWSNSLPAANCIELFHNFSLLHDDIMDEAPLRRGQETAHIKWSENQAILSGDAMFVLASKALEDSRERHLPALLKVYNQTALEVCIGQQLDMEFETRKDVTIDDYLNMIRLKTSVLVGASLKMGAICAGAHPSDLEAIYDFGVQLGIAFQLRDDLLDAYAESADFGKQIGGDILADKKTFLNIKVREKGSAKDVKVLDDLEKIQSKEKVEKVLGVYDSIGVKEDIELEIEAYSEKALLSLEKTSLNKDNKAAFAELVDFLMSRNV